MRRGLVMLLAGLALLLSGCEIRGELVVNDDGSGTFAFVFGIPKEFLAFVPAGEDPFGDVRRDVADAPFPVEVEDYETERVRGVRVSFAFSSVDDLGSKLETFSEEQGATPGGDFQDFSLRETGDGWSFRASASDVDAGFSEFGGEDFPLDPAQLEELLDLRFVVTLPGAPGDHNADEVSRSGGKTTFTWRLSPTQSSVDFRASTAGGSGFPVLPVAAGGGAAVILAGGFALSRLRGAGSAAAGAVFEGTEPGAGEGAPPSGFGGDQPPPPSPPPPPPPPPPGAPPQGGGPTPPRA